MSANVSQTAGLPMYDPPELHAIVDAWWSGLARAFRAEGIPDVPDRLDRSLSLDALWGAPDLLLTQTCGFPLFGSWADRLQYLATPRYAAPAARAPTIAAGSWSTRTHPRIASKTCAAHAARSARGSRIQATTRCAD